MLRSVFAAIVSSAVCSTMASAATVLVDFSLSDTNYTATGYFTFSSVNDTTADALTFTSGNFGEDSASFDLTPRSSVLNIFTLSPTGEVITAEFIADSLSTDPLITFILFYNDFDPPQYAQLACFDAVSPESNCAGLKTGNLIDDGSVSLATRDTTPSPIPLPAGFPLLLAGLIGLAALRIPRNRV